MENVRLFRTRRGVGVGILLVCLGSTACEPTEPVSSKDGGAPRGAAEESLRADQRRVYPEAAAGRFVSLADFETYPGRPAAAQGEQFQIIPNRADGTIQLDEANPRTGRGALAVHLPADQELIFTPPTAQDLRPYTLLSLAVRGERFRDDLRVILTSPAGSWTSSRTILQPGWNNVLIDIRRLDGQTDFDARNVRSITLRFDAAGDARLVVDDVLLIDNTREIQPTPPGITLQKRGLDYTVRLPGREEPVRFAQCEDGLWRLGVHQPMVQFVGPDEPLPAGGESIGYLGAHRVGRVEVPEHNSLRLRIANTWYFPARAGVSPEARHVRWTATFYADGRWVNHVELSNAGGRPIRAAGFSLPRRQATWSDGLISRTRRETDFVGPVTHWSYLLPPAGPDVPPLQDNYTCPARIDTTLGLADCFAPGDLGRDGFDESQGCYFLASRNGLCRFTVHPAVGSLLRPVFRIMGPFDGPVSVNSRGLAIRDVVRLSGGSILFVFPEDVTSPTAVEVTSRDLENPAETTAEKLENWKKKDPKGDILGSTKKSHPGRIGS